MKFLALTDVDSLNQELDFVTTNCRVIGGCDLYTTKPTGSDRKLLRTINGTFESRFEADARLSASLSPPQDGSDMFSRASPFGPLDQSSSRKTYAYLLATLNASHPDHEFSSFIKPDHFRKERSMKTMMNRFNTALFNAGKVIPRMWEIIDQEMDLKDCVLYAYEPDNVEDPYFADGLLWRLTYFLFNKHKKRVCYLYLRAISNSSHMSQSQTMSAWRDGGDGDEDEDEELWTSENDSLWSDNYDAYDFVENMDL